MHQITFPLKPDMLGPEVANLQDALLLLIDKDIIQVSAAQLPTFKNLLSQEQHDQAYKDGTKQVVILFQGQHQQARTGTVDGPTADALNQFLKDLGAFDTQASDTHRLVGGRVSSDSGQPFKGGVVRAFHEDGAGALRLGEDTTDADGRYTIRYEALPGSDSINLRVALLDEAGKTVQVSKLVSQARPVEVIDLVMPAIEPSADVHRIDGRILFDHGLPAPGVTLRLYRQGFGGAEGAALLAETKTDAHGLYNLPYVAQGVANLEVRAVDATGKEVSLSKIVRNAGEREVLSLVAPTMVQPLAAEFTRLTADLQPHVGELSRLAEAKETTETADLTFLHEHTGWDARVIAMAATATKFSAANETGLPHDALYGLLRAGLPSDKLHLARVSNEAFDQALSKARTAGIVSLSDQQVAQIKQNFADFSVNTRLAVQAPGSHATYGDLLQKLNLSNAQQKTFAQLYLNHRGDAASLWKKAADAGLGAIVPRLQKQGKLAFLTTNNPELTAKIQSDLGDADPRKLVEMALHKKENWLNLIATVPPIFADKETYAEDMARRVRISYSTEVTWHMIETQELKIEGQGFPATVGLFLKNAIAKGFKLGQMPVDPFIQAHPDVLNGIAPDQVVPTTQMVKSLQRVYQITPGSDAMKALLNEGLISAQDVLAYPLDVFLARFGPLFPSLDQAQLVYRKAEQVRNVTTSLFTLAKELEGAPSVFALSASPAVRKGVRDELIQHFPTLESLFGSLDFCECEHCRSVLSPAAYLVDLLQFLDQEPKVWESFLKDWKAKHGNAPYPFKNQDDFVAAGSPADTERMPYAILIERRPDLPHIPLTCENTQTALPHIDLVNEILEYYVAHNALQADAAKDTGDATTAELLAEPQNIGSPGEQ